MIVLILVVSMGMYSAADALEIGDYGDEVVRLHQKLAELGYYSLRAESPWSEASINALKGVQYVMGWDETVDTESILKIDDSLPQFAIKKISAIDEYLDFINSPDFTVFISMMDEASNRLQDSTKERLKNLGLKTEWTDRYRKPYIAVIDKNTIVEELAAETATGAPLKADGAVGNITYHIISASPENDGGWNGLIMLNDREYSKNSRGLNIVVVRDDRIIDSAVFDTYADWNAKAKR